MYDICRNDNQSTNNNSIFLSKRESICLLRALYFYRVLTAVLLLILFNACLLSGVINKHNVFSRAHYLTKKKKKQSFIKCILGKHWLLLLKYNE